MSGQDWRQHSTGDTPSGHNGGLAICLHTAAALFHHYVMRDNTLAAHAAAARLTPLLHQTGPEVARASHASGRHMQFSGASRQPACNLAVISSAGNGRLNR